MKRTLLRAGWRAAEISEGIEFEVVRLQCPLCMPKLVNFKLPVNVLSQIVGGPDQVVSVFR